MPEAFYCGHYVLQCMLRERIGVADIGSTPILARASSGAALDPKIGAIVDSIQQLTLLETASLVSELKVRAGG